MVCALVCAVLAEPSRVASDGALFRAWAAQHGKAYASAAEEERRFGLFRASQALVEQHNARTDRTFSMALNRFADLSVDEFFAQSTMETWQHKPDCALNVTGTRPRSRVEAAVASPLTRDWREAGIVHPPKDQGRCGSCWAFSTVGAIESHYAKATGQLLSLSEQQLVDCTRFEGNAGCSGGWPIRAMDYVKRQGGLDDEAAYPYAAADQSCQFSRRGVKARIRAFENVFDEDDLGFVVGNIGPASVCFQVTADFRFYKTGVYASNTCSSATASINHAVVVVGYGNVNATVGFWIVKNSWGVGWGDGGYFKMLRGANMCGVADCASYPVVDAVVA